MAGLAIARVEAVPLEIVVAIATIAVIALLLTRFLPVLLLTMLAGIVWGSAALFWHAYQVSFNESWISGYQPVIAEVEQVNETASYSRVRLSDIRQNNGDELPGRVDIYLYGKDRMQQLMPGQIIQASVKLHPPHNKLNPGAFDYRGYCFDRHIALIGSGKNVVLIDGQITLLEHIRQRIISALPDGETSGVIRALLLADRSHVSIDVQESFAAAGAAHLLAISGLHVGLVASWGVLLTWWLLTRRESWIVHLPVRKIAISAGLLMAIGYATIAGWPLTAQRSVLMLSAAVLAWWLRHQSSPINSMLAALMFILFIDPAAIESISLWLSFIAVTALLVWALGDGQKRARDLSNPLAWLKALFMVSMVSMLATLPVIADLFGRVPTYSLIANLLMVPLYSIWILPLSIVGEALAILGLEHAAEWLFDLAVSGISYGNILLVELKAWPAGNLWVGDVPLWIGFLYMSGMIVSAFFLLKKKYRQLLAFSSLTLMLYLAVVVPENHMPTPELTVWDVGQGAATTLSMPDGGVMAVDLPGRYGSRFNGGTDVAAGLREDGLLHVDALVISHAQSDHAGGVLRLLDQVRDVKELWLADVPANRRYSIMTQAEDHITSRGGLVRWLKRGDKLMFSDAKVEVLWPPQGFEPKNGNNSSLVLSLTLATGSRILFAGDIEKPSEHMIISGNRLDMQKLSHDVMLLPHHGSRTSSSDEWIDAVSPAVVIAQTGFANRYHFPNVDVVRRYRSRGIKVFDTKKGAVIVHPDAAADQELKIEQFKPKISEKRDTALQWWQAAL